MATRVLSATTNKIVLALTDESCPRNPWQLARVTEVYPSKDLYRKVFVLVTQKKKFFERPKKKFLRILIYHPTEGESDN